MRKTKQQIASIMMFVLIVSIGIAHGQTPTSRIAAASSDDRFTNLLADARPQRGAGFGLMPSSRGANVSRPSFNITPMAAGPNLTVLGGGTLGRLTKWVGFTSSNSFIGDSTIFEDKYGLVGIGTDSPTSKLTVAGTIQSTSGGFKFPDGTVQTTSAAGALFGVAHDATLTGNGTPASPLSVVSTDATLEPFEQHITCFVPDGQQVQICPITTVPMGKRLVIEYVSAGLAIDSAQILLAPELNVGGTPYVFVPVVYGSGTGFTFYAVAQQTRIYVDQGKEVKFKVSRRPPFSGLVSADVTVSGRLVDLP